MSHASELELPVNFPFIAGANYELMPIGVQWLYEFDPAQADFDFNPPIPCSVEVTQTYTAGPDLRAKNQSANYSYLITVDSDGLPQQEVIRSGHNLPIIAIQRWEKYLHPNGTPLTYAIFESLANLGTSHITLLRGPHDAAAEVRALYVNESFNETFDEPKFTEAAGDAGKTKADVTDTDEPYKNYYYLNQTSDNRIVVERSTNLSNRGVDKIYYYIGSLVSICSSLSPDNPFEANFLYSSNKLKEIAGITRQPILAKPSSCYDDGDEDEEESACLEYIDRPFELTYDYKDRLIIARLSRMGYSVMKQTRHYDDLGRPVKVELAARTGGSGLLNTQIEAKYAPTGTGLN